LDRTVVILAGGKGTRLYPYTVSLPKPLLPVGDKPILEIIIKQLRHAGFSNIILAVNHQADIIMSYFGTGKQFDVHITYSLENEPLSTMAPLKLLDELPDQFLVMNGDVLTNLDFHFFFENHRSSKVDFTVASYRAVQKSEYGVLELDDQYRVIGFKEKPPTELIVSMGIYAMSKQMLSIIPDDGPFGFDDLMCAGIDKKLSISAAIHDGYWRDLGSPEEYQKANEEIKTIAKSLLL
jgi:NDP-sugar pyrophosphorylase family protein